MKNKTHALSILTSTLVLTLINVLGGHALAKDVFAGATALTTAAQLEKFSKDMGGAFSPKAMLPAEPLGITGFDVALDVLSVKVENEDLFKVARGENKSTVIYPRIHVVKGLPFGIDVGGSLAKFSGATVAGLEARYAIISGNLALPAVGVRASYNLMQGSDVVDFSSKALDVSVSKGFLNVTPYAGLGNVWSTTKINKSALKEQSQTKSFAGVNVAIGIFGFGAELDKTGDTMTYGFKISAAW